MGVTAAGCPEQVVALRALVDELCDTSVAKVTDHLQRFIASQTSPFSVSSLTSVTGEAVPGFRVRKSGSVYTVHNAAVIRLLEVNDVMARLRKVAVDGFVVDRDCFLKYLRHALAERLSALPSLQVVFVDQRLIDTERFNVNCFMAVCAEKPRRPRRLGLPVGRL